MAFLLPVSISHFFSHSCGLDRVSIRTIFGQNGNRTGQRNEKHTHYKRTMVGVSSQYHDDEMEGVDDVEHSLPTPEGQRVASALDNGHSGGSGWTKRKKGMVFLGVGSVVILVLIIAISVSLAGKGGGSGSSSAVQGAANPQSFNAVVEYLSGFQGVFGDRTTLTTPGTPQNLAAIWMADDAFTNIPTTDLVDEAFPFVKRYALAVLYYALNGPSWTNQYSFLTHTEVCERWQQSYTTNALDSGLTCGVRCDATGHVVEIFLRKYLWSDCVTVALSRCN